MTCLVYTVDLFILPFSEAGEGVYLTMKSEWASCMMSFSERMCSCCLVSTMCRFFRIFMAKVLFSSLLSWTCKKWETERKNFSSAFTSTWWAITKILGNNFHSAMLPTSSTRPKPPTPSVSMILKSARLRLKKNAFSASYLLHRKKKGEKQNGGLD